MIGDLNEAVLRDMMFSERWCDVFFCFFKGENKTVFGPRCLAGENKTFFGPCCFEGENREDLRGDSYFSCENLLGVLLGVLVGVIQDRGTRSFLQGDLTSKHFRLEGLKDRGDAEIELVLERLSIYKDIV